MNPRALLLGLALGTAALSSAFRPRGTELVFAPDEGTSLTSELSMRWEQSLDDLSILADGEERGGGFELDIEIDHTVAFTDEIVSVTDGRPTAIRRSYDELSLVIAQSVSGPMGDRDDEQEGESDLEGSVVLFEWDADDGAYTRSLEEGDADEALVQKLEAELDFRALLPDAEVAEGESWSIPIEALELVLRMGGEMGFRFGDEESEDDDEDEDRFEGVEGSFEATLEEVREVDGVRVAVISLEVEVEDEDEGQTEQDIEGPGGSFQVVEEFTTVTEMLLEGELLWNLSGRHLHSLTLEGDTEINREATVTIEIGGEERVQEREESISGTIAISFSVSGG